MMSIVYDICVQAVGGQSPRPNVEVMADVVLAMLRHHSAILQSCLNHVTARDGFPTPRATRDEKQQFTQKIFALVFFIVRSAVFNTV